MNTPAIITEAEFAQRAHERRQEMRANWLAGAIRWRDHARQCKTPFGRAQARRYMRQDALAWRRHWEGL